jgi:RimJ/RimL family protein N-acetyltransferase
MVSVVLIDRAQRHAMRHLIEEIAEAIYGNPNEIAFAEEFIPLGGRVPLPKTNNFVNFLVKYPELLWAVKYDDKTVGFILIGDLPIQTNSAGFSINSQYANKGIVTEAFKLILSAPTPIQLPLYASTSTRNINAQKLLEKLNFVKIDGVFVFLGESSFKYKLDSI